MIKYVNKEELFFINEMENLEVKLQNHLLSVNNLSLEVKLLNQMARYYNNNYYLSVECLPPITKMFTFKITKENKILWEEATFI